MRRAASATRAPAHPKASPLRHLLSAPYRALCRARDLYVRSLLSCASAVGHGHVACPGGQHAPLPRSFSVGSSRLDDGRGGEDDDFRELVRAASARSLGYSPEDLEDVLREIRKSRSGVGRSTRVLPKSCSLGMGRIEEERECDVAAGERESVRRSRSHAVVDGMIKYVRKSLSGTEMSGFYDRDKPYPHMYNLDAAGSPLIRPLDSGGPFQRRLSASPPTSCLPNEVPIPL